MTSSRILVQKDEKIVRACKRLEVIQPAIEIASILEIGYYPASQSSFHIEVTSPV